jgi:hypothetical protein
MTSRSMIMIELLSATSSDTGTPKLLFCFLLVLMAFAGVVWRWVQFFLTPKFERAHVVRTTSLLLPLFLIPAIVTIAVAKKSLGLDPALVGLYSGIAVVPFLLGCLMMVLSSWLVGTVPHRSHYHMR